MAKTLPTHDKHGNVIDPKRCPAIKKNGYQCKNVAGKWTSHSGAEGSYCTRHRGNDGPVKTFEHAKYTPDWLSKRIEHFKSDPQLMSIRPIVQQQKAMLSVLQERYESENAITQDAIELFARVNEGIAKNIERQHNIEIKREYLVSIQKVNEIVEEFVKIVGELATDDKQRVIAVRRLEVVAALKGGNGDNYLST